MAQWGTGEKRRTLDFAGIMWLTWVTSRQSLLLQAETASHVQQHLRKKGVVRPRVVVCTSLDLSNIVACEYVATGHTCY